jgi:uncharacterized protein YjbI with pentapeptide repeats
MANEEHLALLKQGVEAWNHWREEHGDILPDLHWADLSETDLFRANLRWADLSGADLSRADMRWADLSGADLSGADLDGADLRNIRMLDTIWAILIRTKSRR